MLKIWQKLLNLLKTIWGEGFLSPGGTNEIDEVIKEIDVSGKNVLDIGCGCGGAAIHFIKSHNVKSVLGIDTESLVIQRAEELALEYNLEYIQDKDIKNLIVWPFSHYQLVIKSNKRFN